MKKKSSPMLSGIAVLLVVAFLCWGAYFLASKIVSARSNSLRNAIGMPATSNQTIKPLGNGLVYYDGGSLRAMDANGRQTWGYPAGSLADFNVYDGGVSTWTGTMVSMLDAKTGKALFSVPMENNIISARLGTNYAAVQLETPKTNSTGAVDAVKEHNSVMVILDLGGHHVDEIELSNQTVLDFGFFYGGQLLWVMSLDTEGTVPLCSINTYRPGKTRTGTVEDVEQVLYEAMFLQSSKIRVVGLTHVKDFDYQGKEIAENRMLVYGWYLMDVDKKQQSPLMVFVPTAQSDDADGVTDLRAIQGQVDTPIRLPSPARQVFAKGDTVYAFSTDRVMICKVGDLEPTTYALPIVIDRVLALTDNHAAIVSHGVSVSMIPLR